MLCEMAEFHQLRSSKDAGSKGWQLLNQIAEKRAKEEPSAAMPTLDHASMKDFDEVYEPSDDTYLLIDGMKADISKQDSTTLQSKFKILLEIGCGSGVPIVHLAKLIPSARPMATDINPKALQFASRTAKENGVTNLQTIQCDLASGLLPKYEGQIDIVIFNPPYVPTPDEEVAGNSIEASWAGGERGRRVIDRAIPQIAELLSRPHGVCYMITVDDNDPEEVAEIFERHGLQMAPFVRRRAHNEFLTMQKITIKV